MERCVRFVRFFFGVTPFQLMGLFARGLGPLVVLGFFKGSLARELPPRATWRMGEPSKDGLGQFGLVSGSFKQPESLGDLGNHHGC